MVRKHNYMLRTHTKTVCPESTCSTFSTTVCQGVDHDSIVPEMWSEAHRSHKAGFKLLPGILLVPSLLLATRDRSISDFSFLLGPTLQEGVLLGRSCW